MHGLLVHWDDADNSCFAKITVEFAHHLVLEFYNSVDKRIKSGVTGSFYIVARVEFVTVLANNNFTFIDSLVTEYFNAKALGDRVSS